MFEHQRIVIPISANNDSYINGLETYENGVVFRVENTVCNVENHYEDFGSAKLYLFSDKIVYVITDVDYRIEAESNLNKEVCR